MPSDNPAEVARRYLMEGEGVAAIARSLGTRPSYVLRLLLLHGVYERHHPSHSEWARAHAPGKDAEDEAATPLPDQAPPAPLLAAPLPPDQDPVQAYLAQLAPAWRRHSQPVVERIARLLSDGHADAATLDWAALGPEHATALRARLATRYTPSTANAYLWALRRVLAECRRLGRLDHAAYARLASVPSLPLPRRAGSAAGPDEAGT